MASFAAKYDHITPQSPISLFGYPDRFEPYQAIDDELEVNCLQLSDQDTAVFLISLDLLYAHEQLIVDLFREKNEANTILCASHTHFAPSVDSTKPRLGPVNNDYLKLVQSKVNNVVDQNEMRELKEIVHYKAAFSGAVNRRKRKFEGRFNPLNWKYVTEMAPNSEGRVSSDIDILLFKDSKDEAKAVLWKYACHPTHHPNVHAVSSCFPGIVRSALRGRFGNIPVLFLQGLSGDISPIQISEIEKPNSFSRFIESDYDEWCKQLSDNIVNALDKEPYKVYNPKIHFKEESISLGDILTQPIPGVDQLKIKVLNLCDQLSLVGFSAEPVSVYEDIVSSEINDEVLTFGYMDNVFGYLPTDKMVKEGGYESSDFFRMFGYDENNGFKSNVESKIRKGIKSLK